MQLCKCSLQLQIDEADIQKQEVDKSRWGDVLAPCCNIQLQWTGPRNAAVTELQHSVAIQGTTVSGNFFTISYYPGEEDEEAEDDDDMARPLVNRHRLVSTCTIHTNNHFSSHTYKYQIFPDLSRRCNTGK